MLKFYDRQCRKCGKIDYDVLAECAADLGEECKCGGLKVWKPSVGSTDKHSSFYDIQTGQTFDNYHHMEKWCKEHGNTVMTPSEQDSHRPSRKDDSKLRQTIDRNLYRLANGYRD